MADTTLKDQLMQRQAPQGDYVAKTMHKAQSIGPTSVFEKARQYWGDAMRNGPPVAGIAVPIAKASEFMNIGEEAPGALAALGRMLDEAEHTAGKTNWLDVLGKLTGRSHITTPTVMDLFPRGKTLGQSGMLEMGANEGIPPKTWED